MHATFRPFATVGVAVVGAGLIGVTPVAAPRDQLANDPARVGAGSVTYPNRIFTGCIHIKWRCRPCVVRSSSAAIAGGAGRWSIVGETSQYLPR